MLLAVNLPKKKNKEVSASFLICLSAQLYIGSFLQKNGYFNIKNESLLRVVGSQKETRGLEINFWGCKGVPVIKIGCFPW